MVNVLVALTEPLTASYFTVYLPAVSVANLPFVCGISFPESLATVTSTDSASLPRLSVAVHANTG